MNGDIWEDGSEIDFILDLTDDSLHLHDEGYARCWRGLPRKEKQHRRKTCVFIADPGDDNLCTLCIRSSKERKAPEEVAPSTEVFQDLDGTVCF